MAYSFENGPLQGEADRSFETQIDLENSRDATSMIKDTFESVKDASKQALGRVASKFTIKFPPIA